MRRLRGIKWTYSPQLAGALALAWLWFARPEAWLW